MPQHHHRHAHSHGHFHQPTAILLTRRPHDYEDDWIRSLFALIIVAVSIALVLDLALSVANVATPQVMAFAATSSVGAGSSLVFSAATLGLGALLVYGAVGLGYLYSAAKECYSNEKNAVDVVRTRIFNEDGLTAKGIVKSIGAALWSPCLLMGGLAGMGVKATANLFNSSRASKIPEVPAPQSHARMKALQAEGNEIDKDMKEKPRRIAEEEESLHFETLFYETRAVQGVQQKPDANYQFQSSFASVK